MIIDHVSYKNVCKIIYFSWTIIRVLYSYVCRCECMRRPKRWLGTERFSMIKTKQIIVKLLTMAIHYIKRLFSMVPVINVIYL